MTRNARRIQRAARRLIFLSSYHRGLYAPFLCVAESRWTVAAATREFKSPF